MEDTVKIIYDSQSNDVKITYADKVFDNTRLKNIPIESWVFPFYTHNVKWNGLYEELKAFTGKDRFILHFDGDTHALEVIKYALSGTPVKLVGTDNTVTIIYNENPFMTKITVNGVLFDSTVIQNRCIEEWINPIPIRGIQWNGIFNELEKFIGTDIYTIYFIGEQNFIHLLINQCPEGVSVFYRDVNLAKKAQAAKSAEKTNPTPVAASAQKALKNIQQNASAVNLENIAGESGSLSFLRKNIITIFAVLAILLLFLPFASFSAAAEAEGMSIESEVIKTNGFDAMFGIDEIKIGNNNSIFAFLLLIIPILIIVLNYIKIPNPAKKWISISIPALGIIAEIITLLDLKGLWKTFIEEGVKLKTSLGAGFFLLIICYILITAVNLNTHLGIGLPNKKSRKERL